MHGYRVLSARQHGGDALVISDQHPGTIDLVSDVVMPHMNGRELAARLQVRRPTLRVLYMSGYTYGAIEQHGVVGPEVHLLQKPFIPQALIRAVRELVESTPAAGSGRAAQP
jgi:response regulator RpfG family c-di-GMP phosphodiesterase